MTSSGGVRARVGHKRNPQIIVSSAYGWLPYTDPRGICRSGSSSVGHLPSTQMCGGRVIYTIRTQILLASVDLGRPRSATSPVHRSSLHLCTGVSPCALGCFRTQILLSSVDLGCPRLATPNIYSSVCGRLLSSATTSTARHRQVQGAGSIVPIADIQYLPTLCQMRAATLELTSALSMRGCVQHGSAPDPLPNTHSG